jgi:hypothetical protein
VEDIITNATNGLKGYYKYPSDIASKKRQLERCIAAQGEYFEGDNIQQALS